MIELYSEDDWITIPEIDDFMEKYDTHGVFKTRHGWKDNFILHFNKIIATNQILTLRDGDKLVGLCSWAIVDEQRKKDINKTTWALPDNIVDGNILYIDVCLIKSPASIYKFKRFLDRKVRPNVNEIFWFNSPGGRVYRLMLKGGVPCQTAA